MTDRHGETADNRAGNRSDGYPAHRTWRAPGAPVEHLHGRTYAHIFTSPLQRAKRTCELPVRAVARVDPTCRWNGNDGLTRDEISTATRWQLFRDGCPGGESVAEIGARADGVVGRVRALDDDVLLFSSGHFLRVLAARWLGLEASCGRLFLLSTTTLSTLGYEHDKRNPVIRLWNDVRPGLD